MYRAPSGVFHCTIRIPDGAGLTSLLYTYTPAASPKRGMRLCCCMMHMWEVAGLGEIQIRSLQLILLNTYLGNFDLWGKKFIILLCSVYESIRPPASFRSAEIYVIPICVPVSLLRT